MPNDLGFGPPPPAPPAEPPPENLGFLSLDEVVEVESGDGFVPLEDEPPTPGGGFVELPDEPEASPAATPEAPSLSFGGAAYQLAATAVTRGAISEWERQREDEELRKDAQLQHLFEDVLAPLKTNRSRMVGEMISRTGMSPEYVDRHFDEIWRSYSRSQTAPRDWRKWRQENRNFARLILSTGHLGKMVVKDEPIRRFYTALKATKYGLESAVDALIDPRRLKRVPGFEDHDPAKKEEERGKEAREIALGIDLASGAARPEKVEVEQAPEAELTGIERATIPITEFLRQRKLSEKAEIGRQLADRAARRAEARLVGGHPDPEDDAEVLELEKRLGLLKREMRPLDYGGGELTQLGVDTATIGASAVTTLGATAEAYGAVGAVGGLAGGASGFVAAGPAGVLPGAAAGAKGAMAALGPAAARVWAGVASYQDTRGLVYEEIRNERTDAGEPLSDEVALGISNVSALIVAGSDTLTFGTSARMFGPVGDIVAGTSKREAGKQLVKMAAKDSTLKAIFSKWGRRSIEGATVEAVTEAMQDLGGDLATWSGKSIQAGKVQAADPVEALARGMDTAITTFRGTLGLGIGGAPVSLAQPLVKYTMGKRAAARVKAIVDMAGESSTVGAMPHAVAELIERETADSGEKVTHMYVDPNAFARYFQSENGDPLEAAEKVMGPEGPKKLQDAQASGTKLEIPVAEYLEKWASQPVAAALVGDTTTRPGYATATELAAQEKEIEAKAKAIQSAFEASKEVEKQEATEPDADVDFARTLASQLEDAGHSKADAQAYASIHAAFRSVAGGQFKISPDILFRRQQLTVEALGRDTNVDPASALLNIATELEGKPEAKADEIYRDPATDLLNEKAWKETPVPEGKHVVVFDFPYTKAINDDARYGGHAIADGGYRLVGSALTKHFANVFKVRGQLQVVADPHDQGALEQLEKRINDAIPDKEFFVLAASGPTVEAAKASMDSKKKALRADKKYPEREDLSPALRKRLPNLRLPKRGTPSQMPAHLVAKASTADVTKEAFRGLKGLHSYRAWTRIRRKNSVASFDVAGLALANQRFGHAAGDRLLEFFAEAMAAVGGPRFDSTHRSGDEYLAQHDNRKELTAFIKRLTAYLEANPLVFRATDGSLVDVHVRFRHGVGTGKDAELASDRDLNRKRAAEKEALARGVSRGSGERGSDAGANRPGRGPAVGEPSDVAADEEVAPSSTTVVTPQSPEGEPARYTLVEASELIPSHLSTSFQPNPAYPVGVQEREYHRQTEEQMKVTQGAQRLNPAFVLSNTPSPVDGPPLVTSGARALVLGGNGRAMMLQRAMGGADLRAAYKKELQKRAPTLGIDPAQVEGMTAPVLVRAMEKLKDTSPREELVSAVRRFNEGMTQALSAKVRAVAEAKTLSPTSITSIGRLLTDAGDVTLRDVLRERGAEVIAILRRDGIITPQNQSAMVKEGNQLSDEAKDRVEGLFIGRVVGSGDRMAATAPAVLQKLERIAPDLLTVEGTAPALNEIGTVQAALDLLADANRRGLQLQELVGQQGLFEDVRVDPAVVRMAELLRDSKPKELQARFSTWAQKASASNQGAMFEEAPTPASVRKALFGGDTFKQETYFQDLPLQPGPVWHSALERAALSAKQAKGDAKSWLAVLSKTPGVKKEEMELLGLEEWLGKQAGSITRDAVVEFIQANKIEVEEKVLGGGMSKDEARGSLRKLGQKLDQLDASGKYRVTFEDGELLLSLQDDAGEVQHIWGGESVAARLAEDRLIAPGEVPLVDIERTLRGEGAKAVQYQDYATPGGTEGSYRELLFYAPGSEGFRSSHFGDHGENLLAHARFQEHTLASGEKVLLIEEVQSDLHQAGREKGYRPPKAEIQAELKAAQDRVRETTNAAAAEMKALDLDPHEREALFYNWENYDDKEFQPANEPRGRLGELLQSHREAYRARREIAKRGDQGVPEAPFRESWEAMVLRRLVRWAAEKGYQKIAWTTGETQADRYGLAKHVDRLEYSPDTQALTGFKGAGRQVFEQRATPEELPGIIGREAASKLLADKPTLYTAISVEQYRADLQKYGLENEPAEVKDQPADRGLVLDNMGRVDTIDTTLEQAQKRADEYNARATKRLEGEGLKLGGEGMKVAYDKRIPGAVEKLVKKFGGKVAKEPLDAGAKVRDDLDIQVWVDRDAEADARAQGLEAENAKADDVWTATLPEKLRETVVREGMPLFQEQPGGGGPRGQLDITRAAAKKLYKITLSPTADFSTFLHESGHVFLDQLAELASREDAPKSITDNFTAALKWLGVEKASDIKTEHHERWARALEAYFYEGKSPSPALARVFTRFRIWLRQVYQSIKSLVGADELNPHIRDVFDRLFATDEEIESTRAAMGLQPLFRSPQEAGMTPEQWAAYLETQERTLGAASERATKRVLRDQLRETESWWRTEEAKRVKEAEKAYEKLTARRAQRYLKDGELMDEGGEVVLLPKDEVPKLRRQDVVDLVGLERSKAFEGLVRKEGAHPDDVAALFGYSTGREMLEAVAGLPEKQAWTEARAEEAMHEAYPDILGEKEQMRELVATGLHSEFSSDWLLREWDALKQKATVLVENPEANRQQQIDRELIGMAPAPVEAIKRAARDIVRGMTIGRLDVGQALAQERAAGEKAARAAAKGEWQFAFLYKQQQLLQHWMFKELEKARTQRDQLFDLSSDLSKDKARARLGKADPAYRDAVDGLLEGLALKEVDQRRDEPLRPLTEAWKAMEANGDAPVFDTDTINAFAEGEREWRELTVEEMEQVLAALTQLRTSARNRTTVLVQGRRVEKEEVIRKLTAEAEASLPDLGPASSSVSAETGRKTLGGLASSFDGSLLKIETMLGWLGNRDLQSTWAQAILLPMQHAKQREADILKSTVRPAMDAFLQVPKEVRRRMFEAVDGKKLFPSHRQDIDAPTRRFELLMLALNMGNDSNKKRLLEGRSISEQEVMTALDSLTQEEWSWVQSVWDAADSLWPAARELEERDSGLPPPKIEETPVKTRHGTFRGGYFPAVYDRRVERVGEVQAARQVAELQDATYTRPGTARSHLKKRSDDFAGAIALDPSIIQAHFVQVAHDLAFREVIKSVGGLILTPEVDKVLKRRLGDERAGQFLQWVKDVGTMRGAQVTNHVRGMQRLLGKFRSNLILGSLGWAADVAIGDFANLAVGATVVKPKHWAAGLAECITNPFDSFRLAEEKSGEIRFRHEALMTNFQREMRRLTERGPFARGPLAWYRDHAFSFMEWTDRLTSTPVWMGAYRQALAEGMSDADAVLHADAIIRKIFPSRSPVDTAAIIRDKGFIGFTTVFYGYLSTMYSRQRDIVHDLHTAQGAEAKLRALPKVAGRLMALWFCYAVLGELLTGRGPDGEEGEDELERWANWAKRKMLLAPISTLPFGVGQVAESALKKEAPTERASPGVAFMSQLGRAVYRVMTEQENEDSTKEVIQLLKAIGITLGIPTRPLRAAQYFADVEEGELPEPAGPADVLGGVIYGQRPEGQGLNPFTMFGQ